MNTLKKRHLLRKYLRPVLGIVIGGLLGLGYYLLIGCKSGNCAITGSPLGSMLIGSLVGLFITSSPCSRGAC